MMTLFFLLAHMHANKMRKKNPEKNKQTKKLEFVAGIGHFTVICAYLMSNLWAGTKMMRIFDLNSNEKFAAETNPSVTQTHATNKCTIGRR